MWRPRGCRLTALGVISFVAFASISDVALAQNNNSTDPPVPEPTDPPVPAPTEAPVPEPTEPPVPDPTEAPVPEPTDPPVPDPTPAPVPDPTPAPVPDPTTAPVPDPTPAPVPDPTQAPVPEPTDPPVPDPTPSPTRAPVEAPVTDLPTATPTSKPTRAPVTFPTTNDPTASPTSKPTVEPTVEPTSKPTRAPVVGPTTEFPTATPTVAPTAAPSKAPVPEDETASPTAAPSEAPVPPGETASPTAEWGPPIPGDYDGMSMSLQGINSKLTRSAQTGFMQSYEKYVIDYYANNQNAKVKVDSVRVTYVDSVPSGGRRRLQSDAETEVVYDIDFVYQTSREDFTKDRFVNNPFNNDPKRQAYADNYLTPSDEDFYADLTTVSALSFPPPPPPSGGESDNTTTIIIAVCASVGGLLLIGGGYYLYSRDKKKKEAALGDDVGPDGEGKPPSQLQLSTLGGPDEVSTLAEPTPRMGVIQGGESLAGYGDQSVATVDYDYSKAYGGGGDSIVSETGGTLGSGTRGGATATGDSAGAGPSAAGASQSVFSDSSFSQLGGSSGVKEELIDIYAPPGKLGVVIDTPDDGPPVVHAIKDSSVIADQLKVGDKLVSVDDDDVRSMTAIKVSKIISRKSANPTRKLSVIRTSVG